jgi:hypothetical protein
MLAILRIEETENVGLLKARSWWEKMEQDRGVAFMM